MTNNEIAKAILAKNAKLEEVAKQDKSYKVIAEMLSGRTMAAIGNKAGCYVNKHDLIWALINEAKGTAEEELDLTGF